MPPGDSITRVAGAAGQFHKIGSRLDSIRPLDPLAEPQWDSLLANSRGNSFFHTSNWAGVLRDTYHHRPCYFTSSSNSTLDGLLPVMEVSSPWTGIRGVSLPFTDFCPVIVPPGGGPELLRRALEYGRERKWRYLECRGAGLEPAAEPSLRFSAHIVEISRDTGALFRKLSGPVRRGVRKAEESGLRVEFAASPEAMRDFYALHCQTRLRHGVPPQPIRFFENILQHVLAPGRGFIARAWLGNKPIASAVFFQFCREAIYKFGASDYRFQHARANNLLMWESIKHCAELGCDSLHLGRTSIGQEGLRRFKLGLGALEESLAYYRYDFRREAFVAASDRARSGLTRLFRKLPLPLFRFAGRLIYPHLS